MRRRAVWRKRFRRIIEVIMRNRLPWRWQLAALPFLLAAIWFGNLREAPSQLPQPAPEAGNSNAALYQVIAQNRGGATVCGTGQVSKVLKDDTEGSRHQRFILDIGARQTVLVAHNIDLGRACPICRSPTASLSAANTRRTRAAALSTGRTATPAGVMPTAGWSCAASGISENQPTKKTGIKPVFL